MTTPISGATSTAGAAQTQPATDPTGGQDMFMKLLVAQLKYQNPMSPTDSNQYMSQMAIFTQVEKLGQLVDAQKTQQALQERLAAEALVGKQVTGKAADSTVHTGLVSKVTFGTNGPSLSLTDGSTVAVGDVSTVEQP